MTVLPQAEPSTRLARAHRFPIAGVPHKRPGGRRGSALTSPAAGIIQATDLIGHFIHHDCPARCVFANGHIQSALDLIPHPSVHIGNKGADNILGNKYVGIIPSS